MQKRRCQAIHPELNKRCELKEHRLSGPHRLFRRRRPEDVIEWDEPPLDGKKIVGAVIDDRGLVAFTREQAGDFVNALNRGTKGVLSMFDRRHDKVSVVVIEDPEDAIESGRAGTVKASHGEPLDDDIMEKLSYLLVPCWSCGSLPVVICSERGHRLICPDFTQAASACRRSLKARSRVRFEDAAFDWRMMQRDRA